MDIVDKDFDSLFCVVLVVEAIMRMAANGGAALLDFRKGG